MCQSRSLILNCKLLFLQFESLNYAHKYDRQNQKCIGIELFRKHQSGKLQITYTLRFEKKKIISKKNILNIVTSPVCSEFNSEYPSLYWDRQQTSKQTSTYNSHQVLWRKQVLVETDGGRGKEAVLVRILKEVSFGNEVFKLWSKGREDTAQARRQDERTTAWEDAPRQWRACV